MYIQLKPRRRGRSSVQQNLADVMSGVKLHRPRQGVRLLLLLNSTFFCGPYEGTEHKSRGDQRMCYKTQWQEANPITHPMSDTEKLRPPCSASHAMLPTTSILACTYDVVSSSSLWHPTTPAHCDYDNPWPMPPRKPTNCMHQMAATPGPAFSPHQSTKHNAAQTDKATAPKLLRRLHKLYTRYITAASAIGYRCFKIGSPEQGKSKGAHDSTFGSHDIVQKFETRASTRTRVYQSFQLSIQLSKHSSGQTARPHTPPEQQHLQG